MSSIVLVTLWTTSSKASLKSSNFSLIIPLALSRMLSSEEEELEEPESWWMIVDLLRGLESSEEEEEELEELEEDFRLWRAFFAKLRVALSVLGRDSLEEEEEEGEGFLEFEEFKDLLLIDLSLEEEEEEELDRLEEEDFWCLTCFF